MYSCSLLVLLSLLFLWSVAKDSGTYSNATATLLDRLYEIGAHTHTQLQLVLRGRTWHTLLGQHLCQLCPRALETFEIGIRFCWVMGSVPRTDGHDA